MSKLKYVVNPFTGQLDATNDLSPPNPEVVIENISAFPTPASTTNSFYLAQTFLSTGDLDISSLNLQFRYSTAPITGAVTAEIWGISGGQPDDTNVIAASTNSLDASTLTDEYSPFEFTFSPAASILNGTTYAIVVKPETISGFMDLRLASGSYADGSYLFANSPGLNGTWTDNPTQDVWFQLIGIPTPEQSVTSVNGESGDVTVKDISGPNGSVTADSSDMDLTGALLGDGHFQVKNASGAGVLQTSGNSYIQSKEIQRIISETSVDYSIGRNWLFNSKTSHREAVTKVTMMASDPTKEVSLFTGSLFGYDIIIYFGTHVNHQSPFTIVCPGTGIIGFPSGIIMDTPGQAVRLRQTATSEYVVTGANFDIFGEASSVGTTERNTVSANVTDGADALTISGLTQDQPYLLHCLYNLQNGPSAANPSSLAVQGAGIASSPVQSDGTELQLVGSFSLIVHPDVNGEVRFVPFNSIADTISVELDVVIVPLAATKGSGF